MWIWLCDFIYIISKLYSFLDPKIIICPLFSLYLLSGHLQQVNYLNTDLTVTP